MSNSPIRIGTRDSKLAMWQANHVAQLLRVQGHSVEIVDVKSEGDLDTSKPLHELGTTGIFTKVLDDALYDGRVDIAVHSLKDYPTRPPEGIVLSAHLQREDPMDLLIPSGDTSWLEDKNSSVTIGTGSIRRKAQWLHRFPNHTTENLRGNVQTRMRKLGENDWSGIIMASAGLRRMEAVPANAIPLDWMVPAPAQGVIGITHLSDNRLAQSVCEAINDETSHKTSTIERSFLRTLEGGCSAPIGALARISSNVVFFIGCLHSLDGSKEIKIERTGDISDWENLGITWAQEVIAMGGDAIMKEL